MADKEKDPFEGFGWDVEIVRLVDLHVLFNSSPEHGVNGAKRYRNNYIMTPFL